jgi:hypothetical protein
VDWQDAYQSPGHTHLEFKGAGSTSHEQRASMQRQLAAMCSSADFLAPDSWPANSCLTSYTYEDGFESQDDGVCLQAAIHSPSLAHLEVDMGSTSSDWLLGGLSILQRLTSITLSSSFPCGTLDEEVIEGIGQLSSLQRLHIELHLLDACEEDFEGDDSDEDEEEDESSKGFAIPASWLALSSLTHVSFIPCSDGQDEGDREPRLLAAQLSRLAAVEHLQLQSDYPCSTSLSTVGGVSSLFALTRLTSLLGPSSGFHSLAGNVAGGQAGSSRALEVPQQWRNGLQRLNWSERASGSSLPMLAQLTSLTYLHLTGACVSPQLCR